MSNKGPYDATGVHVTVQLPASAQNAAVAANGGTCSVASSVATCSFGVLRSGASNAITVSAVWQVTGAVALAASVSGDQPDANSANNTVSTASTVANLADLSVTATGNSTASVGDTVSYTLVVANAGPNVAAATQLTYQLAAGLTPGSVTSAGATCTSDASGLVKCNVGDLAAAKSVTVTVGATAAAAGTQSSTASVSSGAVNE